MIKTGINIIPVMPVAEALDLMQAAEELGYDYCLMADEGFTPDVYVTLGAAATQTKTIHLGPVTNGYTRHPAATAVAMATLNELSNGRALLTLVAGGSVVLDSFNIPRQAPLGVLRDTIEICRLLWSGETVDRQGERFSLAQARLERGRQDIPIWVAGRGEKVLALAGEKADGALLMVKPDLGPAIQRVGARRPDGKPLRVYMERMAYTPHMIEDATRLFPFVLKDTPERQLRGFLNEAEIGELQQALQNGGTDAAAKLITPEMIKRYKIAGTPQECHSTVNELIRQHELDVFMLNITSAGLKENIRMLQDIKTIIEGGSGLQQIGC